MLRDTHPNSDNSHQHDLDWWAFRYIADELDPADRDAFELRLTNDQSARDAIVSAMEVSQKIFAAGNFLAAHEHLAARNYSVNSHRVDQAVDDALAQSKSLMGEPSTRLGESGTDSVAETRSDYRVRWSSVTAVSAAVLLLAAGGYWFSQNSPSAASTNNQVAKGFGQPAESSSKDLAAKSVDDVDSIGHDADGTPVLAAVWVESLDTSVDSFLADTREAESAVLTDVVYFPEASNEECEWLWTALDGLESSDAESASETDAESNDMDRDGVVPKVDETQTEDEDNQQTELKN